MSLGPLFHWIDQHKHSLLLTLLCVGLLVQPLLHFRSELYSYMVFLAVFMVILERRWQRVVALLAGVPAVVCEAISYLADEPYRSWARAGNLALVIVFMVFGVTTILGTIFNLKRIRRDHVIGAFSGLVLAGVAWGNLYLLIEMVAPGCFHVRDEVAWRLQDEQMRHFLFNHLSFSTLTTIGTGDIEPAVPFVQTLAWFESLFGQFYVAVFIGQLIGLKLSQAGGPTPGQFPSPGDRK
ncbi:MAG: hypothetical protein JSS27_02830 [Planctomycetes bacterium]|nr:hypothetical protein [Planctomycetota bacterium]